MSKKVFLSYSHKQGEWVWKNLKPCLDAGGADVRIDKERFRAGKDVTAQMDAEQDASDLSVLVLSPEYLTSAMCQHEMQRALACNKFVGVVRADCTVPEEINKTLYVDLRDDKAADKWGMLMRACEADLGATVPAWLHARDQIINSFKKERSICLETKGKVKWRELINDIQERSLHDLKKVDLQSGSTCSRRGLIEEILWVGGSRVEVKREPNDLKTLQKVITERKGTTQLALLRFDMVAGRKYHNKADFFGTLKNLVEQKERKLLLLIQTRRSLEEILPQELIDSPIDLDYIELVGPI